MDKTLTLTLYFLCKFIVWVWVDGVYHTLRAFVWGIRYCYRIWYSMSHSACLIGLFFEIVGPVFLMSVNGYFIFIWLAVSIIMIKLSLLVCLSVYLSVCVTYPNSDQEFRRLFLSAFSFVYFFAVRLHTWCHEGAFFCCMYLSIF